MKNTRVCAGIVALASLVGAAACSSSDKTESSPPTSSPTSSPAAHAARRVIFSGKATLDGRPVSSRWVGAVVLADGLVTPCQTVLPPVARGRYSVPVFTEAASAGCGKPGSEVALWIYAGDKIVFSTDTFPWPDAPTATFDATYSAGDPNGATPAVAQFNGGAFDASGKALPAGTRVEAFVGDTRCGVASVRTSRDFTGYILSVVGPDSIGGCTRGAPIAFRLDGKPATPTNIENTPPGRDKALDLKVA